MRLTVA